MRVVVVLTLSGREVPIGVDDLGTKAV